MNIRMQLIRAAAAMAIIAGLATAETLSPPATTDADCPLAKAVKPQRILLLDPIQKHPTWIDARNDSPGGAAVQSTADSKHAGLLHGAVAS